MVALTHIRQSLSAQRRDNDIQHTGKMSKFHCLTVLFSEYPTVCVRHNNQPIVQHQVWKSSESKAAIRREDRISSCRHHPRGCKITLRHHEIIYSPAKACFYLNYKCIHPSLSHFTHEIMNICQVLCVP